MMYTTTPNRRKRWYDFLSISRPVLLFVVGAVVLLLLALLGTMILYTMRAQRYDLDSVGRYSGISMLYDAENRPIAPLKGGENPLVTWEQLPQNLVNAFVAREDEKFFSHNGVVLTSVLRSALQNVLSMRYEQGASTITMQLTRNVYELQGKSMDRKLLETALAQRIERKYSKPMILTQYLNRIYFGQGCSGVGEAARHYFGKKVQDLNLVECATLAGLVRAPSLCNPEVNMENALGVKRETLARMLEMEMITQEQHDRALMAPIELCKDRRKPTASYTTMFAADELNTLVTEAGETGGGLAVVTSLNLDIQQLLEQYSEQALAAVETRGEFPDAWLNLFENEEQAAQAKKVFTSSRRPAKMKVRGIGNDVEDVLQCCALVIDVRRGKKGQILAVTGGRCAVDERNRWEESIRPGRCFAPLVFCCACLPGGEDRHIVARDAEVTGKSIGYDVVRAFLDSLKLRSALPSREQESDLYLGNFAMPRLELAKLLFSLQNEGRGYDLHLIQHIWSGSGSTRLLYVNEPEKAPEYIRRESAVAVSGLTPFVQADGKPLELHETLPDGCGQWNMIINNRGVCVFVWLGYDNPRHPLAQNGDIRRLLRLAGSYLARSVHTEARRILREQMRAEEEARKQQS